MGSILQKIISALEGQFKPELLQLEAGEIASLQAHVSALPDGFEKSALQVVLNALDTAEKAAIDMLP